MFEINPLKIVSACEDCPYYDKKKKKRKNGCVQNMIDEAVEIASNAALSREDYSKTFNNVIAEMTKKISIHQLGKYKCMDDMRLL